MDNLLPAENDKDDPEISSAACSFLVSISLASNFPESQGLLVSEIKASISRVLSQSFCHSKYLALQAIANLISSIIDASSIDEKAVELRQKFSGSNNSDLKPSHIVKLLKRKGLVTDLARIPHNLDLSSQYMPTIVNAALKPLESFVRMFNTAYDSSDRQYSSQSRRHEAINAVSSPQEVANSTEGIQQERGNGSTMDVAIERHRQDSIMNDPSRCQEVDHEEITRGKATLY